MTHDTQSAQMLQKCNDHDPNIYMQFKKADNMHTRLMAIHQLCTWAHDVRLHTSLVPKNQRVPNNSNKNHNKTG